MQGFFGDVGLGACPGLGLVQKRTNLGEQVGREGVLALERVDALQPGEDAPCFVHLSTVAASSRRVCDASDTKASTRERAGGEVAGRTRPQAEQSFVQRGEEPRTVGVLEHFDDRPADVVRDLNAARLAPRKRAEAVDQPGALDVAILTTDESLGAYGMLDCGLYIQTFMLAARSLGIDSIAQAALASYPAFIRQFLDLPADRKLVCGISFGYAIAEHPIHSYRTERTSAADAVTFVEN